LFAPIENLGLIILDEEHEASYKQESVPRYHAKAVATFLARKHGCPLVLGSATPSVESFYEAELSERGKTGITLLGLPRRAASAQLPDVQVEDLTHGYHVGRPSILTEPLRSSVEETLVKHEQAILFLNRRAYAPFSICRDCGHQMQCPNCSVSLSFHRKEYRLKCHHCGFQARPPESCPKCAGLRMNPFGVGTEKVEELIRETFPSARIARLDRDVARRKGAIEQTFASFRAREIDILVGTQMVAKGLDFPYVTLVGVIAADITLNIPDFRAGERTFQLLSQVAGRAGRGTAKGRVIIQTFNPEHPSVRFSRQHDYPAFYEQLKQERLEAGYPPFRRLVNVVLSGESRDDVQSAAEQVRKRLGTLGKTAQVLGPVDCVVERVQSRWRRHMVVKLPPGASPQPVQDRLLDFAPKGVLITLDVDPYNLM
jgi:primosomal protein N' (replication factor Y)